MVFSFWFFRFHFFPRSFSFSSLLPPCAMDDNLELHGVEGHCFFAEVRPRIRGSEVEMIGRMLHFSEFVQHVYPQDGSDKTVVVFRGRETV